TAGARRHACGRRRRASSAHGRQGLETRRTFARGVGRSHWRLQGASGPVHQSRKGGRSRKAREGGLVSEPMQIYPEIWPVAADELGIWLISGSEGAWRPRLPVMADSEPHADIDLELADRDVRTDTTFLHSTSWRIDGPFLIVTYLAVVSRPGFVRDH